MNLKIYKNKKTIRNFEKFYNIKTLKTSGDIKRKLMELVKGNLKEDADEDLVGAIGTLLEAAVAKGRHEVLESIVTKAQHLQSRENHLH